MQELSNQFSFPPELVNDAVCLPTGHFAEVDNVLYEANKLGRKVVQTQAVMIGGKEVSVGYLGGEAVNYELVVASENPLDLGSFKDIIEGNKDLFSAMHQAFGGSVSSYLPIEMVTAIRMSVAAGLAPADTVQLAKVAGDARKQVKRGTWIASNNIAAFARAPLDWNSIGL